MILSSTRSGPLLKDFSLPNTLVSVLTWGFGVPGGTQMQAALPMGVRKARAQADALDLTLPPLVLSEAIPGNRI